jgi:hypothetical protein
MKHVRISHTLIAILLASAVYGQWAEITLEWDPVTTYLDSTPVEGTVTYRLWISTSSFMRPDSTWMTPGEAESKAALSIRETQATEMKVDSLYHGWRYYFRLTAIDSLRRESEFNRDENGNHVEVSYDVPLVKAYYPTGLRARFEDIIIRISNFIDQGE